MGLGNTTNQSLPQKLTKKFTQLILGREHTCGIESVTGDTYCWGINTYGQLGFGNTTQYTTSQKLNGITSYEKTCEDGFTLEETTGRCWQNKQ